MVQKDLRRRPERFEVSGVEVGNDDFRRKLRRMKPLRVLFISDDYPGHFNFADGVLAAIKRLRPVECETWSVRGRLAYRMQAVRPLALGNRLAMRCALRLGF